MEFWSVPVQTPAPQASPSLKHSLQQSILEERRKEGTVLYGSYFHHRRGVLHTMEQEAEGARREELKGKCVGHSSKPHQIQIPVLTKTCLEVVSLPRFFFD